jgi:hypothetical protein
MGGRGCCCWRGLLARPLVGCASARGGERAVPSAADQRPLLRPAPAAGNVGERGVGLDDNDGLCTWLSSDGGATWQDVGEGAYIYEYAGEVQQQPAPSAGGRPARRAVLRVLPRLLACSCSWRLAGPARLKHAFDQRLPPPADWGGFIVMTRHELSGAADEVGCQP